MAQIAAKQKGLCPKLAKALVLSEIISFDDPIFIF
jgi:hypothetical protein